jgi:hypothetical protein
MFMASRFPVRLIVRCSSCGKQLEILRDDYERAQMFCATDDLPLIVTGVIAGAPLGAKLVPVFMPNLQIVRRTRHEHVHTEGSELAAV